MGYFPGQFFLFDMALQQRFFRLVRLLSLILFVFFVPLCNATCYGLDGNTMTSEFQPCSSVAGAITVCCATNRTNYFGGSSLHGATADQCLPNGLCHNLEVNSPSVTYVQYWRNGCTTTPVDDERCLNVCTKPEQVVSLVPLLFASNQSLINREYRFRAVSL